MLLDPIQTRPIPAPTHSPGARTYSYQNQDAPRSGARPAALQPAPQSRCVASAISSRPTPPSPTRRPKKKKLVHAFSSNAAFQMAIQSAEAQASTLAKLAPPHTATHKLGHQLLNFRSCTSLGRYQLCFFDHPDTSTQTRLSNRCVGQTLTIVTCSLIIVIAALLFLEHHIRGLHSALAR